MKKDEIIVVTGLPRSGTSMMMQILQSMEIEIFTDNKRSPNESNPKGYYEHELVKTIDKEMSWLKNVKGKAIKIVSPLLVYLPENYYYKIIFMQRALNEVINSQDKMLNSNASDISQIEPEILKQIFTKDLKQARNWINEHSNSEYLDISYSKILIAPDSELNKIKQFLNINVDLKNVKKVIDNNLYRSRIS